MQYPNKDQIYDFWLNRLRSIESESQVCTNDVALDELETQQILSRITPNSTVLEIGCGIGLLYQKLVESTALTEYVGTDVVHEFIEVCRRKRRNDNDRFFQLDMTEVNSETFNKKFDFIISKRAIQNITDRDAQIRVIEAFGKHLTYGGKLVLVESSAEAQENLNRERVKYGLDELKTPFHNLFFDDGLIQKYKFKNVKLIAIDNFSSDFYFITRVIYARLANEYLKDKPSYDHPLQKIALTMSPKNVTTDFSQIKCYVFEKL